MKINEILDEGAVAFCLNLVPFSSQNTVLDTRAYFEQNLPKEVLVVRFIIDQYLLRGAFFSKLELITLSAPPPILSPGSIKTHMCLHTKRVVKQINKQDA